MKSPVWILYGTQSCHLCDEAEALLNQYSRASGILWRYVDIALLPEDDMLKLATHIPILKVGDSQLRWPFGLADIQHIATQAFY